MHHWSMNCFITFECPLKGWIVKKWVMIFEKYNNVLITESQVQLWNGVISTFKRIQHQTSKYYFSKLEMGGESAEDGFHFKLSFEPTQD